MINNKITEAVLYCAMVSAVGYGIIKFTIVMIDFLR